ncbi:hypothetical protein EGR_06512 [Echinococcus granulosus]|uniref:Uncharacterized protein n=1 Tax=Echinococcus granulosus TaxID=6210 RepID=W6UYI0_ECHGR|nr:hypothetical protein EGR_06512 [Echinococcus granulosus]EUB58629.1 hypothetical protein EGR_06512 [Echinococcus granulosus]
MRTDLLLVNALTHLVNAKSFSLQSSGENSLFLYMFKSFYLSFETTFMIYGKLSATGDLLVTPPDAKDVFCEAIATPNACIQRKIFSHQSSTFPLGAYFPQIAHLSGLLLAYVVLRNSKVMFSSSKTVVGVWFERKIRCTELLIPKQNVFFGDKEGLFWPSLNQGCNNVAYSINSTIYVDLWFVVQLKFPPSKSYKEKKRRSPCITLLSDKLVTMLFPSVAEQNSSSTSDLQVK